MWIDVPCSYFDSCLQRLLPSGKSSHSAATFGEYETYIIMCHLFVTVEVGKLC